MKTELHPEAEAELYAPAAWYDDQLPGLGVELLAEITRCLAVVVEGPSAWPRWPDAPALNPPIRRVLASRFPYAIGYRAYSNRIQVLAIAHTSPAVCHDIVHNAARVVATHPGPPNRYVASRP